MSRGSVSIDVRTGVSIHVEWKMSVDGRVSSIDSVERVSSDELVLLSIDEEHLSLRIERSKLAGCDENSS